MKGLSIGFIYAASLGAITLGINAGYFDGYEGPLVLFWALAGLALATVGIVRRDK